MKVADDTAQAWSMTQASIKEDGPIGHDFLVRLEFWTRTADKMMEETALFVGNDKPASSVTPANALRKALEVMERELGMIDVFFLGQMLVVIGMYWEHGDQAMRELSPIELKLAGHSLAVKIGEENEKAAREAMTADLAGIIHKPTEEEAAGGDE